jgi:uncharacterized protein (DUF2141 family)
VRAPGHAADTSVRCNGAIMRKRHLLLLLLAAAACGSRGVQAADLTVEVRGAQSDKGRVMVGLFTDPQTFPKQYIRYSVADPVRASVTVVFKDLPAGDYAVSAFHDENRNKVLDRGMYGIPKERYGFSNNARGDRGPPEFRDAKFTLDRAGGRVVVELK